MSSSTVTLPTGTGSRKSNLAFALATLPGARRRDALVFYDFCRAVDDIADSPDLPVGEKQSRLALWREAIASDALPEPLRDIVHRYHLDSGLLSEIVRGVEMDLSPQDFRTFDDLHTYCWRVACAVGLVSIGIFGCSELASRDYAENLGLALQVTNILRDVAEDASLGRIYLPAEDLARFGVRRESLLARKPDGQFDALMRHEAERARRYFAAARRTLPPRDARSLIPAEAMREIYERLLASMERDGFRVFQKSYRLATQEKIFILAKHLLRRMLRAA